MLQLLVRPLGKQPLPCLLFRGQPVPTKAWRVPLRNLEEELYDKDCKVLWQAKAWADTGNHESIVETQNGNRKEPGTRNLELRIRTGNRETGVWWEPGTGNREPGTGNREPGTGNLEPGTGNREPGTGNREPGTGNRELGANQKQGTGNREPGTGNREPGTGNWVLGGNREPGSGSWVGSGNREPGAGSLELGEKGSH
jgi:hypothetical protein